MKTTTPDQTASTPETSAAVELAPEKLHLRTLLVPTDFSESSRKAIHYAVRLAQQFGSTVVLLHVIEPVYAYSVDGSMYCPSDLHDPNMARRPEAEKGLASLADLTAREGRCPFAR